MKAITLWMVVLATGLLGACGDTKPTTDAGLSTPLNTDEITGLKYMREEEELARDLYMTIFNNKGLSVFQSISLNSEVGHAQQMLSLLNTYGEADPSTGIANTYTDPALQTLSDQLINTATGATSTDLDALMVGALVEEVDIADINHEKSLVQPTHALMTQTYDNLLCGSRNHLRSFVSQIELLTGAAYVAQVPAVAVEVASILASPNERCSR